MCVGEKWPLITIFEFMPVEFPTVYPTFYTLGMSDKLFVPLRQNLVSIKLTNYTLRNI